MYQQGGKSKYLIRAIFLTIVSSLFTYVASNFVTNPWQAIQISPIALYQIDYGSRRMEIRDHLRNHEQTDAKRKIYYVSPLGELDPFSAVRKCNNITNICEVRFIVRMWDDELIRTAWEYLKEHEESGLPVSRVQLLPIQSVALRCSECKGFGINGSPLRASALPRRVYFSLTCETAEEGDRLVELMKSDPTYFQTLRLAFALQGQPLEKKVIAVQLDSTLDGDMYTRIKRQLPGRSIAYLVSADEERLKKEFLRDLQAAYLWKSSDILENYAQELKVGIHNFLVDSRLDSTNFDPSLWQVLFWQNNDGLLRPDQLADGLSKLFEKNDNSVAQDWFKDTTSTTSYSEETQLAAEKRIMERFGTKNVSEFVAKAREFVLWNGTHFVPKPLLLTKIHLVERTDAKNNGRFQVTVQFNSAVLFRDMAIQVEDTHQEPVASKEQITAIMEFLETNITERIEQLTVQIAENVERKWLNTVDNEKNIRELSGSERNNATITPVAQDTQALVHLAGLVAHFHSKPYTPNQPVWYSSVRTSMNDLINSLNGYGLVSYLPPAESLWVAAAEGNKTNFYSHNFWTKSVKHNETVSTTSPDTPVVWDPVNLKLLYFRGKDLQEFPKQTSRFYPHHELDRTISTDAPWRHVSDMSLDWITRNLYILSKNNNFIFVLSIVRPFSWTQLKCSRTDDVIQRLIVDPLGGYLFWSAESSHIRRSWLNGSHVTTIWNPEGSYNISPWSLTIDHETGTLYFIDSSEKTIVSLDRDGNILRTIHLQWANGEVANIFKTSKNLNKVPNGFIVMEQKGVYFVDLNLEVVHRIDDVPVEPASRYAVFSSSVQSYPRSVNPCSRNRTEGCLRQVRSNYEYECVEYGFNDTPCREGICLHNPDGNHTCY